MIFFMEVAFEVKLLLGGDGLENQNQFRYSILHNLFEMILERRFTMACASPKCGRHHNCKNACFLRFANTIQDLRRLYLT